MKFKQYLYLRELALQRLLTMSDNEYAVKQADLQNYAFLGDAVFSVYIRRILLNTEIPSTRVLHDLAADFVSARTQSNIFHAVERYLTEDEQDLCRRARNLKVTTPTSAKVAEYRSSTAWETLLGYHYYHSNSERLSELLQLSFQEIVREIKNDAK